MLPLSCMLRDMPVQLHIIYECHVTQSASVVLVSCICSHVAFQVWVNRECCRADITLECLVSHMLIHMSPELRIIKKCHVSVLAFIWLLSLCDMLRHFRYEALEHCSNANNAVVHKYSPAYTLWCNTGTWQSSVLKLNYRLTNFKKERQASTKWFMKYTRCVHSIFRDE